MKRILLIDDDEDYSQIVKMRLEKEGYGVDCVLGCDDAIRVLEKDFSYNVILLDVDMPERNGLATLSHLRNHFQTGQNPKGFTIPVIICTGLQSSRLAEIFASQKIADYVKKPFDSSDLIQKIEKAISEKGS